jgi:hypothetical protein
MRNSKKLTSAAVICAILLVGGWYAVELTTVVNVSYSYPGIALNGPSGSFLSLRIEPEKFTNESRPVFVRMDGLPVRRLDDVREGDLQNHPNFKPVEWISGVEPRGISYEGERGGMCTFENGRLIELSAYFPPSPTILFGASEDGPFFEIPMSEKEARKAFGPPLQVKRNRSWVSLHP